MSVPHSKWNRQSQSSLSQPQIAARDHATHDSEIWNQRKISGNKLFPAKNVKNVGSFASAQPARTIAVADARMRLLLLKPIEIAKISNKT